jgi:phosphoribosylformylglycinamidine synthase
VLTALREKDQIALVYAENNPNGSTADIAGVCDDTGLVFGPHAHPERHVSALQHPAWTSRGGSEGEGPGLAIFRNAVKFATQGVATGFG